ncbi:DoxX family protein [Hydrocarboniphaga sp.]|uniref:DoxX family protein n=1 Tax=Hydrocarboniphaga sp. TaxID=2033016 RepID=UPI003D136140
MKSAPSPLVTMYRSLVDLAERLVWLAPLLIRIVFGYFWLETGWAKLHNLDGAIQRFGNWGLPVPEFTAPFSAGAEFVFGISMIVGLAFRVTMVGSIINMLVALVVVVLPTIGTLDEFVELDEVLYVLVFFWLLLVGPGKISLDYLIDKKLRG